MSAWSSRAGAIGAAVGLTLLCLALFLPGSRSIPALDRDEARYAQATRQMLESRDFVEIRFQGEPRNKKPVGIYWLQAVSVALSGDGRGDIGAYRIPSLVGATLAVLLTAWTGARLFGWPAGALGAAMLASSLLLCVQARLATTDAVLLAAVVAAQGTLARAYLPSTASPGREWLLFWIAIGAGVLVKGPVILLVSGGTLLALLAFDRSLAWMRRLRPMRGAALAAAIVAPWVLAIGWRTRGRFFADSVGHEILGKLFEGQELHAAPPGFHLLAFWLAFWPFSFIAAAALPWVWSKRGEAAVRFCVAWIVPTWLVFEIAATKLPHYVLPVLPAIALLAAAALEADAASLAGRWRTFALALFALASCVLTFGTALAPAFLERRIEPLALLAAAICALCCAASIRLLAAGRGRTAAALLVAGAVGLYAAAFALDAPGLDSLWISRRVGALVAETRPCPASRVASIGYHEPSLVFALGTDTELVGPALAARHLADDPECALVLSTIENEAALRGELERRSIVARRLGEVRGIDYSTGRRLVLSLWGAGSKRE